jgi:hypothetical protein
MNQDFKPKKFKIKIKKKSLVIINDNTSSNNTNEQPINIKNKGTDAGNANTNKNKLSYKELTELSPEYRIPDETNTTISTNLEEHIKCATTKPSKVEKKPGISIWDHILSTIKFNKELNIQYISAKQIKDAKSSWTGKKSQFEPRILCKMDTRKSRPAIFKKYNLSIISVKNGYYALIKENIYIPLPLYDAVEQKIIKKYDSIVLDIGNSETSMLDKLKYNGVFEEIIGEKIKYGPLLGGRHRCTFETQLGSEIINIKGSQYETDGCYETNNYICIVEAKSIKCIDFNIRQLYYPYREVYKKVGDTKNIISLFIYKDKKEVIHIYKFEWDNHKKMLDIKCSGYFRYIY